MHRWTVIIRCQTTLVNCRHPAGSQRLCRALLAIILKAAVDRLFHDEWGYVRSEIAAGTWDATGATPNQIAAAEEYREAVREVERLS